ncbi:MAG: hypothetical protein JXA13_15030 [Anaerolineales bacterium]|nr:hypothetical protein [Anaerolineales bacterium]
MNRTYPIQLIPFLRKSSLQRGALFGYMILGALLAFEIFNYSTTDFALTDLLGRDLKFIGIRWATILSLAFCGIDFAGIARLFTPEQGRDEPAEVWYLFGAWLLAATMNALLTWWGVSIAITSHTAASSQLINPTTLTKAVPVFVAIMVWLIRVLIIGAFSIAGERLFTMDETRQNVFQTSNRPSATPSYAANTYMRPEPKPKPAVTQHTVRPEPSYHPVGMSAQAGDEHQRTWR